MRWFFPRLVGLFSATTLLVLSVLPSLDAQDGKEEPKTEEKKPEPPKKLVVKVDENIVLSAPKLVGKVKDVKADEKEVIVTLSDEKKVLDFMKWEQSAMLSIRKSRDPKSQIEKFKKDRPNKLDEIFAGETKTVYVTDATRVRTAEPPPQYDAAGTLKKISQADLTKMKGGSTRLPGYIGTFDSIKIGSVVELSIPKAAPAPKQAVAPPVAKKTFIGADPNINIAGAGSTGRIDAYMIFIRAE